MNISPELVSLILKLLIPLFAGLLVKATASTRIRSVVTLILVAVVTLLEANITNTGAAVLSEPTLTVWAQNLAIALAMEFGVFRPIVPKATKLLPLRGLG